MNTITHKRPSKRKGTLLLSMKKLVNLSIDHPIQRSTGNYKTFEKARKNKRDNAVIRTRLKYDQMLERKHKISMINILRTLMKKVDNMQDWIGNLTREVETIKKNQVKMLGIKYIITEIKEYVRVSKVNLTQPRK